MLTVEFYGVLQQQCNGAKTIMAAVPQVQNLLDELTEKYPAANGTLQRTAAAINDEIVPRTYQLTGNETVALLPPVGGG